MRSPERLVGWAACWYDETAVWGTLGRNTGRTMGTNQEIKDKIRDHILKEFLPGEDASNLTDDTALTSSGILDSISTLSLVKYVEDTFGLMVEAHEASADFDRIEDIAALVERKK